MLAASPALLAQASPTLTYISVTKSLGLRQGAFAKGRPCGLRATLLDAAALIGPFPVSLAEVGSKLSTVAGGERSCQGSYVR